MIRVYTGPMFASKSYGLISTYLRRVNTHKSNVECFKPAIDTRDKSYIKSRAQVTELEAHQIQDLSEIKDYIKPTTEFILIDEAQFLSGDVQELLWLTLFNNIDIYISGLNMTSEQTPFKTMEDILSIADEVTNLKADCSDCKAVNSAPYTYCLTEKTSEVMVGNSEYIALCPKCLAKRLIKSYEKRRSI